MKKFIFRLLIFLTLFASISCDPNSTTDDTSQRVNTNANLNIKEAT